MSETPPEPPDVDLDADEMDGGTPAEEPPPPA
jgi:hypothetical protein